MHFHFDSWLLTLSLLIASVVALIAFSFVESLFTATTQKKKVLHTIFSAVLGTAIWANHILLSYAFKLDEGEARNVFPSMTLLAWFFAVVTAALVLNGATRRHLKLSTALGLGSIAALSLLGLYFFDTASALCSPTRPYNSIACRAVYLWCNHWLYHATFLVKKLHWEKYNRGQARFCAHGVA